MRVLQLIDSLRLGGAERVAVNIANELTTRIEKSFLCATREVGPLKEELSDRVVFYFLNRRRTLDFLAFRALKQFIKQNKIEIIHAHASSFFIATVIKIQLPDVKLIWHDHLGSRVKRPLKPWSALKLCSNFFDHVICVNNELLEWSKRNLNVTSLSYLPNFATQSPIRADIYLRGKTGKRIVYLANLRPPKNHMLLLRAFAEVCNGCPDWTLHLVGQDNNDAYSTEIRNFISSNDLESKVFLLGRQNNIASIIKNCSIGIISSDSEGLPMALLEYGIGGLAVISTDVGHCGKVISEFGLIVKPNSIEDLQDALLRLMTNNNLRREYGILFQKHVNSKFGAFSSMNMLQNVYKSQLG